MHTIGQISFSPFLNSCLLQVWLFSKNGHAVARGIRMSRNKIAAFKLFFLTFRDCLGQEFGKEILFCGSCWVLRVLFTMFGRLRSFDPLKEKLTLPRGGATKGNVFQSVCIGFCCTVCSKLQLAVLHSVSRLFCPLAFNSWGEWPLSAGRAPLARLGDEWEWGVWRGCSSQRGV